LGRRAIPLTEGKPEPPNRVALSFYRHIDWTIDWQGLHRVDTNQPLNRTSGTTGGGSLRAVLQLLGLLIIVIVVLLRSRSDGRLAGHR
jgi:hypothetical protein